MSSGIPDEQTDWSTVKAELLKDPKLRKAYDRPDPLYWLKKKWINYRIWRTKDE